MKTWLRILLALIIVGIIAAFLVYRFMYNKPHPDYEKAEARYTLDAGQLFNEFKNGTDSVSKKYNGQVIALKGTLSKIESADSLVIAVFVFSTGDFGDEGVRCTMLPDFAAKARTLPPAVPVDIKGYCTGYNGTDVILEKCSIVPPIN